jgi:Fe-S-cluster containining protein
MSKVKSFSEYVNEGIEDHVYNYTKDGKCSGCGNCCTNIMPLSEKEIRLIRKYIKENKIKEHKRVAPTVKPTIDMTCPFRDNINGICTIYKVRPMICKKFICDSEKRAKIARDLYKQTRMIVDVRATFYGGEDF